MFKKIEEMMDRVPERDEVQDMLDAEPFMNEYKSKIGLIAFSIILAAISAIIFYVVGKKMSPPELFFVTAEGKSIQVAPMSLPNESREAVKDLAREAIQKSYTFDFLKIDQQLLAAQPYYTIDAWGVFKDSMLSSSLVKQVKKNKFTVSVVAKEEPIIDSAAQKAGAEFAWKLLVPITISFSGDSPTETQDLLVRITVVRVPTTENPKGLGVLQMVAGPLGIGGKVK
jgi:intracellular multiplication protein IcmL